MATATIPTKERTQLPIRRQELRPPSLSEPGSSWPLVAARLAVAISAGALHGAAWLFPGAWYAAWLGQAGLISLGFLCAPRRAFAHGFLVGAIGTGSAFYWGIEALRLTMDASIPVALGLYAALIGIEAIAFGMFCAAVAI